MLRDNDVINDVIMRVDTEDFYRDNHQAVYQAITDVYSNGSSVDGIIIADELRRRGVFEKIGGDDLLGELAEWVNHSLDAKRHAAIVHDMAIRRKLIEACSDSIKECYSGLRTANELIDGTESRVFAVADRRASASTVGMDKVVAEAMEKIRKAKDGEVFGMSTGFIDLDDLIGGFRPGQLIILAARPGNGKTAMALNIAANRAENAISTLFVSLEMEAIELAFRMIASKAAIDSRKLMNNDDFKGKEEIRVNKAAVEIEASRLRIDDVPGQSLMKIAANARRLKQRDNLELLVIDYLGLINETATRNQNTVDVLTKISNGLKRLAKELKIPVLALHQLNRSSEHEERKPRKSDLRGSGSLEQDADIILLLHTEMKEDDVAGVVEMIVAKNRGGKTGTVKFWFNKPFNRFEPYALQGQVQAAEREYPIDPYDNERDRPF
jgi:replicative DNA helicase